MKTSELLRKAFRRFEGGEKWSRSPLNGRLCARLAVDAAAGDCTVSYYQAIEYLIKTLPPPFERSRPGLWRYNDAPRRTFAGISWLYGKAIKLAEIDEADADGYAGKARLLRVALALRESKHADRFTMEHYQHLDSAPACALGHYAARPDLQSVAVLGAVLTRADNHECWSMGDRIKHFDISLAELKELFSHVGCSDAETTVQAADYIERFAHEKWPSK